MRKISSKNYVYRGKEFNVIEYEFETKKSIIKWEVIERSDGVVIVPINKKKEVCLIKEYSPIFDKYILTLPGGKTLVKSDSELILEAQRELREETGYRANKMIKLRYYYAAPNLMTRKLHLFLGIDLEYAPLESGEINEIIEPIFIDLDKAIEEVNADFVSDSNTIGSLVLAKNKLKNMGLI